MTKNLIMQILIFALLLSGAFLVQSQVSSFTDLEEVGPVEDPLTRNLKLTPVNASVLLNAFGAKPGSPNWNPEADLNGDEIVDIYDLRIFFANTNVGNGQRVSPCHYASGDRIYDEYGKEVVWRGAGGSYLFHANDYITAWSLHLSEIEKMGANTIRLAFRFPDSNPGFDGYLAADTLDYAKLDEVLSWLDGHNIKAILSCTNYKDMFGDFGSTKLMNNWITLARRYCGDSRIAAYELFNEPGPETWDVSVVSRTDVIEVYANLTDAVRAADPEHIVIWESFGYLAYTWDTDKFSEVLKPYLKSNIVFTFHRWLHKERSFDVWNPEQMSYISAEYLVKTREKLNVPFWLGEFGSYAPFDFSNTEYVWTEQTLWRCEEQVVGWNLWMGRTDIDKPWKEYLLLFPLRVYNEVLVRRPWNIPIPDLRDFMLQGLGIDRIDFYQMEMHDNNDYATLKPGIVVRVLVSHELINGSLELISDETIAVSEQQTIHNEEGTTEHPGDWNIRIYSIGYSP